MNRIQLGFYMNVSVRGTDCLQKSLDGILFSSCHCIMHIKAVFTHSSALYTAVTNETVYYRCSISPTCCQRVAMLLIQLLLFHADVLCSIITQN